MNDTDFIDSFKKTILDCAWSNFLEDRRSDIQDDIGMWKWAGDCVPLVNNLNTVTIEKGMLSFSALLNNREILLSIWIQMGEIRVGYRIPVDLLNADRIGAEKRLACLYDGQPCQRIVRGNDAILFDLIFKDGFAGFEYMKDAFFDHQNGGSSNVMIIADRVHDILVHTFIAVINELISTNSYTVRPGYVGSAKHFNLEIKGDLNAFDLWASTNKVGIVERSDIPGSGGGYLYARCVVPTYIDLSKVKEESWVLVKHTQESRVSHGSSK